MSWPTGYRTLYKNGQSGQEYFRSNWRVLGDQKYLEDIYTVYWPRLLFSCLCLSHRVLDVQSAVARCCTLALTSRGVFLEYRARHFAREEMLSAVSLHATTGKMAVEEAQ
jgi:hypothetical protein